MMNLSAFEKAKETAEEIQAKIEGQKVDNPLGTNDVNVPGEEDYIQDFNKGVEIMGNVNDYQILKENKEYKTGTYRPPVEPEEEDIPMEFMPEIKQERLKMSKVREEEEQELKKAIEKSRNLHIELPQYGRALYIKKNYPEKLAAFLKKYPEHYRGITPEMI